MPGYLSRQMSTKASVFETPCAMIGAARFRLVASNSTPGFRPLLSIVRRNATPVAMIAQASLHHKPERNWWERPAGVMCSPASLRTKRQDLNALRTKRGRLPVSLEVIFHLNLRLQILTVSISGPCGGAWPVTGESRRLVGLHRDQSRCSFLA
jgi:hypothetical protein